MSKRTGRDLYTTKNLFDSISKLETVKAANSCADKAKSKEVSGTPLYNNLMLRGDRYTNEKFIAAGGEKAVFSVYDTYSCRNVALARPIFHRFDSEKEQFIKEALICSKLQHPNIVPVYDIGLDCADIPFFTMKLFVGDTLKDILKNLKEGNEEYKKNYPLNKLLVIFINLCDAIEYAHIHNVIHCDIKPENIHIDKFGSVLVGDWGLSKIIPMTHSSYNKESSLIDLEVNVINANPEPGSIRGTPGYLAPEILKGIHSGDIRSDIYSLGALLYELLSFEKPVPGKTAKEIFENTKKHKLKPLEVKASWERPSEAIRLIVMKSLHLNPNERYECVSDLRKEVTNYLHGFATDAERASYLTLLRLMIHRHKLVSGVIAGFTILILFIIASAYKQIDAEKAEAEIKRDIAEKNLMLFKVVNKKAKLLSDNLSKLAQNSKYISQDSIKYRILAQGYAVNYESNEVDKEILLIEKASLHFIMQEFNNALNSLKFVANDEAHSAYPLYKECQKLAALKPNDNELLSPDELNSYLDNPHDSKMAMQLFYLHVKRSSISHPYNLKEPVRKILNLINDVSSNNFSFELDVVENGSTLDLSHAPYTDFILPIETQRPFNVLAVLKPVSINFRHSWFNEVSKLRGLKLHSINIAHTNIHKTRFWNWVKKLKIQEVTIQENQFPQAEVEAYKEFVKVQYEAE